MAGAVQRFKDELHLSVPSFDITSAKPPVLGPLEKEDVLEKYNRVCLILRALKHTSSPSKWRDHGFENSELSFEPMGIPLRAVPRWMQKKKEKTKKKDEDARDRFPAKKFPLKWDKFWGTKENKDAMKAHIDVYLDENNISPPPEVSTLKQDPRYFQSAAQWRDTLRLELDLQRALMDLAFIDFEIPEAEKVNVFGRADACSWEKAQDLLRENAVSIRLRLKVVEEDYEYVPEYNGPPLEISRYMHLNKEHELLPGAAQNPSKCATGGDPSIPSTQDRLAASALCSGPEDVLLNNRIDQLLSVRTKPRQRDSSNGFQNSDPEKSRDRGEKLAEDLRDATNGEVPLQWKPTITKPTNKPELKRWLAYHDGFDVSTEEGLRAWRKKALSDPRICDANTPAPNTKTSGKMSLKRDKASALKEFDNEAVQTNLEKDYDVSTSAQVGLTLNSLMDRTDISTPKRMTSVFRGRMQAARCSWGHASRTQERFLI